jgi:ABC-type Fe3+-hydroxamate transport system substrate-binding protein
LNKKERVKNKMLICILFTTLIQLLSSSSDQTPKNIAVLSPSATQTLIDIGLADKIACISQPFDSPKLKNSVKKLGFYHNPSIELIIKCKPDLIITSYAGTPPSIHKKLKKLNYNLIMEKPESLDSIKDFIKQMSKKFNKPEPVIVKKFDTICTDVKRKKAVLLVGLNPSIAAGKKSFLSSAMECAGFNNVISGMYPRINPEKLIKINPDILIIAFKNPEEIKDYKILKKIFKDKLVIINPDYLLEPSSKILKGIEDLKKLNK